jgi:hypothetical protein
VRNRQRRHFVGPHLQGPLAKIRSTKDWWAVLRV